MHSSVAKPLKKTLQYIWLVLAGNPPSVLPRAAFRSTIKTEILADLRVHIE